MDSSLNELITDRFTIITPTQRLSRHLRYLYATDQVEQGKHAWQTPDCLPWTAWCKRTFEQISLCSSDKQLLLNELQQQWIWQEIINASSYKDQLLQITATARQAIQAYSMCKQWRVPVFPQDVYLPDDAFAFKSWVASYEKQKQTNRWLDNADLPEYLGSRITESNQSFRKIAFYDFDQLTTQQQGLIQVLKEAGSEVIELAASSKNRSIAVCEQNDLNAEIRAAALWARQCFESNPDANIGIVTPNLGAIRDQLEYGFASVFTPNKWIKPFGTNQQPYSISLGKALSNYPLINSAVNLLALGKRKVSINTLSTLLHSPFIKGATEESAARAKLDAALRKIGEQQLGFKTLYWIVEEKCKEYEKCEEFIQLLKTFEISFLSHAKNQSLRHWAIIFSEWLSVFGWPGERRLNSDEHQIVTTWQLALSQLGSLDGLSKPVSYSTALFQLNRFISETHFQPETAETPIQISGITGAAGMQFDFLWVMDMQDDTWPGLKHASSFIPISCQREYGLPTASAESQLKLAKIITDKLIMSATELVFSYSRQEGDRVCRPSPLIKEHLSKELTIDVQSFEDCQTRIFKSSDIETFIDIAAPTIPQGQIANGGSALFKDQSSCPFKAFARHRLNAESLQQTDIGLSAAERGNLAHRSLQYLWQRLKTSEDLQYRSEVELDKLIHSVVKEAIKQQMSKQPETFTDRFTELEQLRLQQLLKEWLQVERNRSEFKVIATEEWQTILYQDIELHLRVDRIDELADGRCVIIDYKTGAVSKNDWESDNPNDPQLPLYAITREQKVAAIAYGSLKRGKLGFVGQAEEEGILPAVKPDNDLPWQDKLDSWQRVLTQLANDFREGKAIVEPTTTACRYCDLHSFCRIHERIETPDEVDEQEVMFND